jgi:uracil-DNA glycosylase
MNAERNLRQQLEDLQRAGVTHAPLELASLVDELVAQRAESRALSGGTAAVASPEAVTPPTAEKKSVASDEKREIPRLGKSSSKESPAPQAAQPTKASTVSAPEESPSPSPTASKLVPNISDDLKGRITQLAGVAEQVAACSKCQDLANGRTQTVFGVGNPDAEIMFIGEAPGADEDRQGEPFVGESGQLLNKIIVASQLTREEIYICNILRCRPPGNRNPNPTEITNCREFLDAQIDLVKPSYIVCWGSVAAQNLLASGTTIGKMRGRFFEYKGIKVSCTYHPSYLLRNPSAKKMVWEDMKFFRADMGVELS